MAPPGLAYLRAIARAAPAGDLARAVGRRALRALRRPRAKVVVDARAAASALARAPRLLAEVSPGDQYRALFPDGEARFRRRAEQLLDHELEIFGRAFRFGARLDWHADPFSRHRYAPDAPPAELVAGARGADPKNLWEPARAGHLVELAAAGRAVPALAAAARAEVRATIDSFLDDVRPGMGVHYASPLEVALRGIHWLAAVELCGGARAFAPAFAERLGAALHADLQFLDGNLEDAGVVPANHLLADEVGRFVLGLALDGTPGARASWQSAARAVRRESLRQIAADGSHFEASTAYHRFALELLLVAHQAARSGGVALGVSPALRRMLEFTRGYLAPDGGEPGFGDGDDARLMPIVPRAPRAHGYLLSIGVALFGDAQLRAPSEPFAEEALWWLGPAAHDAWLAALPVDDAPSASFPDGGVHVLRSARLFVAMRSGSYGQRGVGGHAHNDQLALVAHACGRPLIVDSGTGCYTRDALERDRFRGTAAHATLVIDGAEQSPFLDGRPFALPDRARATPVEHEDFGAYATLAGEHRGYQRLPARVRHRRRLTLVRERDALLIEDFLDGRGQVAVELRFPVDGEAWLPSAAQAHAWLGREQTILFGALDLSLAVAVGTAPDRPRAILAPVGNFCLRPVAGTAPVSETYGCTVRRGLVSFRGLLSLPSVLKVTLLLPR
ncbi:MAG TPA: alginate lyase family protein [Polyangia bacterium]|nr:alginate lyase family protein [Polyangia bacterium]